MDTPAERLKWARQQAGFRSAAAFARHAEVPEVTYRAHEKGPREPGGRGLSEAAARAYGRLLGGLSWAWLVTGEGVPFPAEGENPEAGTAGFAEAELSALEQRAAAQARREGAWHTPTDAQPKRAAALGAKDLQVYASAEGGNEGMVVIPEPIDLIARPEDVLNVRDAFAVYVIGDSMAPRIEHGEMVVVNPSKPVRRRDDVVFVRHLEDGNWAALVKRLVRWTAEDWIVEQYNPAKEFALPRSLWPRAFAISNRVNP